MTVAAAVGEDGARDRSLELVFRLVPGAVWSTDRDLHITHAHGSALELMGLAGRQVVGMTIAQLTEAWDPTAQIASRHAAALATGQPQAFSHRLNGRHFKVMIEPQRDGASAVTGCVGVAVEVPTDADVAEQLTRARARLDEVQRVAHVGSFEWDLGTNHVTWSDELRRLYGLKGERLEGTYEEFLERVHPDDRDHTRAVLFDTFRKVGPFSYDHRVVLPDGSARLLRVRGEVVAGEKGTPALAFGSCWDVSEPEESTGRLERSVSLLHATLEATFDGLLVVDLEGRVAACNQRFFTLWRIPPELTVRGLDEALLASVLEQLDDPDGFLGGVRDLYAHPERESFDVLRFKDGRVYERTSKPQRVGTEVVGRVWSFRDVTDRERLLRRAEFLADASRLLASLDVDIALDGVAHLAVRYLGDGCAIDLFGDGGPRRLLAVSRDPSAPMSADLHPSVAAGHAALYAVGSISHMAVPLVVQDSVVGAMTFAAGPWRKYAQEDLELGEELARRAALSVANARLFREAEDAIRARDDLLSIATHEIRGPLTSIHLAVQSFRRHPALAQTDLAVPLEIIEREDRRLARFVDELLDLGRIRSGRMHFSFEDADLAQIVQEVAARLGPELARSGSALSITTEGPAVGQWDRFRLEQVVTNLLSNAIKFGLGRPIEISVAARDGKVVLSVKDHGIGIEPAMHQRIFNSFERAVSVRHYGGLGLGLYIARTIVEGLGGTIGVESTPGAGAEFTVELPRAQGT